MGRIFEYVLLLSNLSILLAEKQYNGLSSAADDYGRRKQENSSLAIKQFAPNGHNEFFGKRLRENQGFDFQDRKRSHPSKIQRSQLPKRGGINTYANKDFSLKNKKRNPLDQPKNGFNNFGSLRGDSLGPKNFQRERFTKLALKYHQNNSLNSQSNNPEDLEKSGSVRNYHKSGRNPRFHSPAYPPKFCDPCNNVPWTPLIKAPNSYRQHRKRPIEVFDSHKNIFNFDHSDFGSSIYDSNAFASTNQNIFLAASLIPPLEPVYGRTFSSSFGLPIGNIPTSHGLLPPIHLATTFDTYAANSIDYSNSLNYYFPTQSHLDTKSFPELSPVPVVPIHDSTQFYQFDSTSTHLTPPKKSKTVDVSNVVLTISEDSSGHGHGHAGHIEQGLTPPVQPSLSPVKSHTVFRTDLSSEPTSVVDSQPSHSFSEDYQPVHQYIPVKNQSGEYGELEIVKSVPLAEFSSSVEYALPLLEPPIANQANHSQFFDDRLLKNSHTVQKPIEKNSYHNDNINFLVPPLRDKFNSSEIPSPPFLEPPKLTDVQYQVAAESSVPIPQPLTSSSVSWLFPDQPNVQPTAPKTPEPSHQFFSDTQEIASIVNSELRPISPQPIPTPATNAPHADNSKSKKIQIIIPYTTKNKNAFDSNALESVQQEVFQTIRTSVNNSNHENNSSHHSLRFPPSGTRVAQYEANRSRKVINQTENYSIFNGEKPGIEHRPESEPNNRKYLTEMQHIIASNIRELLHGEIEKSLTDQNLPLQDNIDNWTALEYSNHKTVGTKAPKEIISQALAVTSIPGTSISHLLLPSKKIPNEYFVTTPLPLYDEPNNRQFNATSTIVNSRPFTEKPYATTNLYFPSSRTLPQGVPKPAQESQNKKSTPFNQDNHEKNYTDVGRSRVNNWGRLNENLVLPEARGPSRKVDETTTSAWTTRILASSVESGNVQIVTPVPFANKKNYTTFSYRRTTRHIHSTERTTIANSTMPTTKINQTSAFLSRFNSTRLEKVVNLTSPFNRSFGLTNSTISTGNRSEIVKNFNVSRTEVIKSVRMEPLPWPFARNVSMEELIKLSKTNKSEQFSINDVFPFRNQELPWKSSLNISQEELLRNFRQRKSLIKQVKLSSTPKPVLADFS